MWSFGTEYSILADEKATPRIIIANDAITYA
jgi:hypothetical protein